ncbi:MAG: HAD family hydrolase [Methanocella sp.]|jgi:phosphoglycolate phosphatase-like HAD superfamily hydrolase
MASSINPKVAAVALDFDGIVVNVEVNWKEALKLASTCTGQEVKSLLTFYEQYFGTPVFAQASAEIEKMEIEALKRSPQVPYIAGFLKAVRQKKIPIYIVSMQTKRVIQGYLEEHGLAGFIKEVVGRERFPSKRAQVQYVISQIAGGQVLFVDDLKRNLDSCRDLGVICSFFPRNQNAKDAKESWNRLLELLN